VFPAALESRRCLSAAAVLLLERSFSEAVRALRRPYLARYLHSFHRNGTEGQFGTDGFRAHVPPFCQRRTEAFQCSKARFCIIPSCAMKANKKPVLVLDLKTRFRVCCLYSVVTPGGVMVSTGVWGSKAAWARSANPRPLRGPPGLGGRRRGGGHGGTRAWRPECDGGAGRGWGGQHPLRGSPWQLQGQHQNEEI